MNIMEKTEQIAKKRFDLANASKTPTSAIKLKVPGKLTLANV